MQVQDFHHNRNNGYKIRCEKTQMLHFFLLFLVVVLCYFLVRFIYVYIKDTRAGGDAYISRVVKIETLKNNEVFSENTCSTIKKMIWIDREHFYKNYIHRARPVVFTNITSVWPSHKIWTAEYFKTLGEGLNKSVEISAGTEETSDGVFHKKYFTFAAYMDMIIKLIADSNNNQRNQETPTALQQPNRQQKSIYLKQFDILRVFPEETENIKPLSLFKPIHHVFGSLNLWIGSRLLLSTTGLHNDDEDNILYQIRGHKRIILYPPSERGYLYPNQRYDSGTECCDVLPEYITHPYEGDAENRKKRRIELIEQFPLYAKACAPIVIDLYEGEVLFIPKDWYHAVKNMSDLSISVNQFVSTPMDFIYRGFSRLFGIGLHVLGLYKRNDCVCHASNKKKRG